MRDRVWLLQLRLQRYRRAEESFQSLSQRLKEQAHDDGALTELAWEEICWCSSQTKEFRDLLKTIRRGERHFQGTYVLEAYLWIYASGSKKLIERLPSLETLRKDKELRLPYQGALYDAVKSILQSHDSSIPMERRLGQMANRFHDRHQIASLEGEVLFLLAVLRWLKKNKAHQLAEMVSAEYKTLSLKITKGEQSDCLGLL